MEKVSSEEEYEEENEEDMELMRCSILVKSMTESLFLKDFNEYSESDDELEEYSSDIEVDFETIENSESQSLASNNSKHRHVGRKVLTNPCKIIPEVTKIVNNLETQTDEQNNEKKAQLAENEDMNESDESDFEE